MSDEFALETGPFEEADETLLEELLDRLELQESGQFGGEGQAREVPTSGPPVHLPSIAGCPPETAVQLRRVLRRAIAEAIELANNAATKLEATVAVVPGLRDREAQETARLFKFFFCHDPSRPVPWAGNQASGATVAKRFRAVARELGGGRRITFRCATDCASTARAFTSQDVEPNIINLCPLFWNPPPGMPGLPPEAFRGGVILHEMLHVLFTDFFHHVPTERKRNNAHCFRAFALRAKGYGQDLAALGGCTNRRC